MGRNCFSSYVVSSWGYLLTLGYGSKLMDEVQRIKYAYQRKKNNAASTYSYLFSQQRENEIKIALKREGFASLDMNHILDVGCGSGEVLNYFLKSGAVPENLCGVDLLSERIEHAKRLYPRISFTCGNAEKLPYPDSFFNIITQSTMFTSILDMKMKRGIAAEMLRVLKWNGVIIWHDYRFDNPFNPNAKGIGKEEIQELFPDCQFDFKLVNLNPFIARPLSRLSWRLCEALEKISILRTHWLVTIKKKISGLIKIDR